MDSLRILLHSSCCFVIPTFQTFSMAVASSSAWELRIQQWHDYRRVLTAAGIPQEAFSQRLPKLGRDYQLMGPGGRRAIQVFMVRKAFYLARPVGNMPNINFVQWDDFPTGVEAWETAKRLASW